MKQRHKILAAFWVALVPIGVAWWLFFSGWHSVHTTNQGRLLQPALSAKSLHWFVSYGSHSSQPSGERRWWLLWVSPTGCDSRCMQSLQRLTQVKKALGRERQRVQLVLVTVGLRPTDGLDQHLNKNQEPVGHWLLEKASYEATLKAHLAHQNTGQLFVMDPMGYVVLTYPTQTWDKHVLHDVRHLLRISRIG